MKINVQIYIIIALKLVGNLNGIVFIITINLLSIFYHLCNVKKINFSKVRNTDQSSIIYYITNI